MKVERRDWDNQNEASPVLHFDLTLADIRDYLVNAIQSETKEEMKQYCNSCHEYVRGLIDGNRFCRQKPKMIEKAD